MAIITEEPDNPKPRLRKPKPTPKSEHTAPPRPPPPTKPTSTTVAATNPFRFWFYFTLFVSLITLFFILLSSLSSQDPKTWFLNLPPILRQHYSDGRIIKVQTAPNHPQIEVFSVQQGLTNYDNHVLIVHGIGCSSFGFRNVVKSLGRKNVHVVAIDLPGSGFSDKSIVVVEENVGGKSGLGKLWDVYEEIKEKGIFWGFDQLVEQGYIDFEENEQRVSKKERVKAIELGCEEMGRVIGQVVDSLKLAPVDLVLHDSALGMSANWISKNPGLIRSVMVLDSLPSETAFPIWVLEWPVVREVVLGFRFVFKRILETCCMISVSAIEADAHRILLKGRDGRRAVVGMGKKLNVSFDLSEWSGLDGVKGLPVRVIWSSGWSDEWNIKGRGISNAVPEASLGTHSGGRWTQEHNAEEVAERIYEFVSSLPKSFKQVKEDEPIPEHVQEMFREAESIDHHHHHHGHGGHSHDGHGHGHGHGYMDAYGLDHGWGM